MYDNSGDLWEDLNSILVKQDKDVKHHGSTQMLQAKSDNFC